jgi:NADH-quinone oxidoreductase subunit M
MYLLWALQRLIYNKLDKPENERLIDLSGRELAVLLPLIACIFWIGLYPGPILRRVETSARALVEQVKGPEQPVEHAQVSEVVQ